MVVGLAVLRGPVMGITTGRAPPSREPTYYHPKASHTVYPLHRLMQPVEAVYTPIFKPVVTPVESLTQGEARGRTVTQGSKLRLLNGVTITAS